MVSRLPGAFVRAILAIWLVATPALLLPSAGVDSTQVVALIALFVAGFVFVEYASHYPSFVEFRHAPPFNRIRFVGTFLAVFLLASIHRDAHAPTAITEFLTVVGTLLGRLIDLPYSPVHNMVLSLPIDAEPALVEAVRTSAGLSYLLSMMTLIAFAIIARLDGWPGRYGAFNVWVNLPTFDPTAGGDVVEGLRRDGRVNIALGILLPFVIPAAIKIAPEGLQPFALDAPQTMIWVMTLWAFLPVSLFMRGIAMGRVAKLIEAERRQRYAEFGEDAALA